MLWILADSQYFWVRCCGNFSLFMTSFATCSQPSDNPNASGTCELPDTRNAGSNKQKMFTLSSSHYFVYCAILNLCTNVASRCSLLLLRKKEKLELEVASPCIILVLVRARYVANVWPGEKLKLVRMLYLLSFFLWYYLVFVPCTSALLDNARRKTRQENSYVKKKKNQS